MTFLVSRIENFSIVFKVTGAGCGRIVRLANGTETVRLMTGDGISPIDLHGLLNPLLS